MNFILLLAVGACAHYWRKPDMPSSPNNPGPGAYAHYQWPSGHSNGIAMRVNHIWAVLPNASETQGNAVFASTQQWYQQGPAGYMGTQAWRDRSGKMTYRAVFSCWDADASHKTGWVDEKDGHCERFGGEGTGSHCIIPYTLKQDTEYSVRVFFNGKNQSGAFWKGTITDTSTKITTNIGTLYYPNYKGAVGYGNMKIAAADFLEYFMASGCEDQAVAGAGLVGPYITVSGKTEIVPKQATGDYVSGCPYEDTTGAIPRHGTGSPRIYMLGGGHTKQTIPKGTPLW